MDSCNNLTEFCAESSAIVGAFRHHADLTSSILYTTGKPCPKCAKMIIQSGIKVVICGKYQQKEKKSEKEKSSVDILNRAKIAVW